ncbi:YslB family protein [Sporosarcina koreensis]|uniref:YslB family protein n=1 Tax=Sporosarcina koreensis TaxID=334735 RepID=UPI0005903A60|nr:YslB family protein [Sporosarcina koreensis]
MANETTGQPTRFGYELLRDHVIPDILGKHEDDILYWAGKEIARKFPVFSVDEVPQFFKEAGWGTLVRVSSGKEEIDYELTDRLESPATEDAFSLESGFLAEQHQIANGCLTECYGSRDADTGRIVLQVRWDETYNLGD